VLLSAAVLIRPANDEEAYACRLLMPEAFSPHFVPELWVATATATSQLIGAAAVAWRPLGQPRGFALQVHVLPAERRRGIGTALVETIARTCAGETQHLHAWTFVNEGSEAEAFLKATDFAPRRRFLGFEANLPHSYTLIKAFYDRMSRIGKIPSALQIVALRAAPSQDVAALVAANFPDMPTDTALAIARGLVGYDTLRSVVLLHNGVVKGALLYSWNGGQPLIDVNLVAPEIRHGAANVMLLEAAIRNALAGGADRLQFRCEATVHDTVNLARRAGAKSVAATVALTRALPHHD